MGREGLSYKWIRQDRSGPLRFWTSIKRIRAYLASATPILYNDMIISVMPKDGGGLRGKLVCFSPTDLHNPIWSSAADERFGLGPYLVINKHLFAFKDDGELYVYEIQSKAMKLLKKQRVMDGVDAWGPMAYADGMLVLRDAHTVKCLKIV